MREFEQRPKSRHQEERLQIKVPVLKKHRLAVTVSGSSRSPLTHIALYHFGLTLFAGSSECPRLSKEI